MNYVSLFSGAGGFDIGFDRAGFRCLAQVEIDKTARAVLGKHWPDVPQYPDVREFGAAQVPSADVVVGGFPCQDVSTAGKRAGFEGGVRSSLWFEMVRVIRELRPQFVVWENVPGLLSADEGRAFGWVLRELADLGFDGGWRTVDAQFFGVPQQRRRIFGVFARGDSGAERCAQVLALAKGVCRNSEAGREAGAGTAASAESGAGGGSETAHDGIVPFTFDWQAGGGGGDTSFRGGSRQWVCDKPGRARSLVANKTLAVFGGGSVSGERGGNATLTAKAGARQDFDTENFVLIQDAREGMETKSQNGAGVRVSSVYDTLDTRGTQAVLCHESGQGWWNEADYSGPLRAEGENRPSRPTHVVVEPVPCLKPDATLRGRIDGLSYTLTSRQGRGGDDMAVCVTGTVTHTLTSEGADASEDGTGRGTPIVTTQPLYYTHDYNQDRIYGTDGVTPALTAADSNRTRNQVVAGVVRRLTPRECERLMGWPDDFTRWRADGTEIADGPRYRMCGNGVVGTVSEWIARRIVKYGGLS